jgi:aminoglycoside phosphotransferase
LLKSGRKKEKTEKKEHKKRGSSKILLRNLKSLHDNSIKPVPFNRSFMACPLGATKL